MSSQPGNLIKSFSFSESFLDAAITVQVLHFSKGVSVSLFGGHAPHIGAVAVLSPEGETFLTQFSGHKEGEICQSWALMLKQKGITPAVVQAGIHYDQLTPEGIKQVMKITDRLFYDVLSTLTI